MSQSPVERSSEPPASPMKWAGTLWWCHSFFIYKLAAMLWIPFNLLLANMKSRLGWWTGAKQQSLEIHFLPYGSLCCVCHFSFAADHLTSCALKSQHEESWSCMCGITGWLTGFHICGSSMQIFFTFIMSLFHIFSSFLIFKHVLS